MKSGADGRFECPSVRGGEWKIAAEVTHGDAKWKGFTTFAMPQHGVDDAAVHIAPPFSLAAAVEGLPKDGSIKAKPWAYLASAAGSNQRESSAAVQPDGSLNFETFYAVRYRAGVFSSIPGF